MTDALNPDPLSGINLCSVRRVAAGIAENAIIAYWMEDKDASTFKYFRGLVSEELHNLADLCGYELVKKAAAPASDQQHADVAETSIP